MAPTVIPASTAKIPIISQRDVVASDFVGGTASRLAASFFLSGSSFLSGSVGKR